ncbi:ATPase [Pseudonocardia sp. CNS-139]|nr:ATPase [Pseudonocardia sp. CNS-139]
MIEIAEEIRAIGRRVGRVAAESGETVSVTLERTCDAAVEDVWDAITDPERLRRWFLPVSGDLREGGTFQTEGNAGGEILVCDAPKLLRVTWGGETSVVELRLSPLGDEQTALELQHTVPIEIAQSGAGALYVGPGWDLTLFALGRYAVGVVADDPLAAGGSPEGIELARQSVLAWKATVEESGTATADEVNAGVEVAMAQFAPGTA